MSAKVTCKRCQKKCKMANMKSIECEDGQCDLRYDISVKALTFGDYKKQQTPPKLINEISSVAPPVVVAPELTEAEWLSMCEAGALADPDAFRCPF